MVQDAVDLNTQGENHFLANNVNLATQCFENALDLWPEFVLARSNLGIAYWSQGRPLDAVRHLEAAFLLEPGEFNTALNLYRVLNRFGRVQLAERVRECWRLALKPEDILSADFTFACSIGALYEWAQNASESLTMRTPHTYWKYAETDLKQALNLRVMHYSNLGVENEVFFEQLVLAKELGSEFSFSNSLLPPKRFQHLDEIIVLSRKSIEDARTSFCEFFFEDFIGTSFN